MPEKQERGKMLLWSRISPSASSLRWVFNQFTTFLEQPDGESSRFPQPSTRWCCLTAGDGPAVQLCAGGKILILKNVSLLDILSVQNIFLWDDTQSNSAYSHSDFAISLIDHYFRNGTFFPGYVQTILLFNFLSQTRNADYLTFSPSSLRSVD